MKIKTESKLGNKEYSPKTNIYQSSNAEDLPMTFEELAIYKENIRQEWIKEILEHEIRREHFINKKHLITVDEENFYTWNESALQDLTYDHIRDIICQLDNGLEFFTKYPQVHTEFYNEYIERNNIDLSFLM